MYWNIQDLLFLGCSSWSSCSCYRRCPKIFFGCYHWFTRFQWCYQRVESWNIHKMCMLVNIFVFLNFSWARIWECLCACLPVFGAVWRLQKWSDLADICTLVPWVNIWGCFFIFQKFWFLGPGTFCRNEAKSLGQPGDFKNGWIWFLGPGDEFLESVMYVMPSKGFTCFFGFVNTDGFSLIKSIPGNL